MQLKSLKKDLYQVETYVNLINMFLKSLISWKLFAAVFEWASEQLNDIWIINRLRWFCSW